ncbi:ribulose-phosphate 3-epimerase [Anaerococcus hydrogenalis DSM 7454]|uniref:Ribulose-phosphate 3-epimerase n=1 Tax=Anaerococcus hydrogenalis DSM 7454 TaxID=561177 RepID=B6W6J8_9FIRM|nr:ribulose-phosphate 3-epimerase [Anaerococcus hydrogenalis]EEB36941.1 ribulose-phosphate 3-epimerase [Anaerococcus hydrogenalis DSM 7454]
MVEISPSVLSANFANLQNDLDQLKKTKVKYLHLDIMDGKFVPNISFGFPIIKAIREDNDFIFDTHLMIDEPIRYIDQFKKSGADLITVHYEACSNLDETIEKIKDSGLKVGLSFKPKTDIEKIIPYLEKIDLCLVMSVEPGFGGQSFIKNSIGKIQKLRSYIDDNNLSCLIEVDGGIKDHNLKKVIDAGVDVVVSGSDIFSHKENSIIEQVNKYYEIINE